MIKQSVAFFIFLVVAWQSIAQETPSSVIEMIAPNGGNFKLSIDEISEVKAVDEKGSSVVVFRMSDAKIKSFGSFSGENVGNQIVLTVCGEEVSRPIIQAPLYGGNLLLSGLTKNKAKEYADVLLGRRLCR